MSNIKSLSVFFPCFNEAENIEKTYLDTKKVLERLNLAYEIIIVDDGSQDSTREIADRLAKSDHQVKVIHHLKNLGYGSALKSGFKAAKYPWVAFMDSDGQFDFSEITKLLDKTTQADVILGFRLNRADPLRRKIFTFGWQMLANILLHLNVKDYSCGFKLIKKEVFERAQPLAGEEKVTQIELLVKASRLGYKFAEVGVHHFPRVHGTPTGAKLSVVLKSIIDLFKLWWQIKEQRLLFFVVLGILVLATILRVYDLPGYMTFLGDEGRDAIIVKKLLVEWELPFIGPPTSVGNIYLGPLYYYMMAFAMTVFWLNPMGAALMVAIIGVLTTLLIYYLSKIWFGRVGGIVASFLYAISPVNITYSRSSWNPNPAPFFATLAVWAMYKAHSCLDGKWFILVGFFAAAALQMHYLSIILLAIFGLLWIYKLVWQKGYKNFWWGTGGGILAFWLTMLPLVLFDLKHNFLNYRAIHQILTTNEAVNFSVLDSLMKAPLIYFNNLISRYMAGENMILSYILGILLLLPIVKMWWDQKFKWPTFALLIWLTVGLLGLSFYKSSIFDHYLGFLNPAPYLLLAGAISILLNLKGLQKKSAVVGLIILLIFLTWVNLAKNPLKNPPNNQLQKTKSIAKFIINEAGSKQFNFALISQNNYDSAYRFYLDIYGQKAKDVPFDITDTLFVVCEDAVCDPAHNPKYEITGFGWSKIAGEKEFLGVRIYKLIHNPSGKP